MMDSSGVIHPYLAETLPQLNAESWRLFPDGRMETTYRLKPNLTWHDGQPLTAEDFVFSWRVYSTPELGHATQPPLHAIDEVVALDAQRFVIRWKLPYPDATTLSARDRELPALPRHILGADFEQIAATGPDAIANDPFWSRAYVGAGPYKLERWEP